MNFRKRIRVAQVSAFVIVCNFLQGPVEASFITVSYNNEVDTASALGYDDYDYNSGSSLPYSHVYHASSGGSDSQLTYTSTLSSLTWNYSLQRDGTTGSLAFSSSHGTLTVSHDATFNFLGSFSGTRIDPSNDVLGFQLVGDDGTYWNEYASPNFDFSGTLLAGHRYDLLVSAGYDRYGVGGTGSGSVSLNITDTTASVPEPSSVVLLGLGAIGLAIRARLRRKTEVKNV